MSAVLRRLVAYLRREPAAIAGAVSAAVSLAVSFGLRLSADQTGAIAAALAALAALVVRSQVTPLVSLPPRDPPPPGAVV